MIESWNLHFFILQYTKAQYRTRLNMFSFTKKKQSRKNIPRIAQNWIFYFFLTTVCLNNEKSLSTGPLLLQFTVLTVLA